MTGDDWKERAQGVQVKLRNAATEIEVEEVASEARFFVAELYESSDKLKQGMAHILINLKDQRLIDLRRS